MRTLAWASTSADNISTKSRFMNLPLFEHPGLESQLPHHGDALARREVADRGGSAGVPNRRLSDRVVGAIHQAIYRLVTEVGASANSWWGWRAGGSGQGCSGPSAGSPGSSASCRT